MGISVQFPAMNLPSQALMHLTAYLKTNMPENFQDMTTFTLL